MSARKHAQATAATGTTGAAPVVPAASDAFRTLVCAEGVRLYRDLPWRNTCDPYEIWLSEVMLQQTQVARVEQRWGTWLERFPSVEALAAAPVAEVLAAWQGMGYNRRALALKSAAEKIVAEHGGVFPQKTEELVALPGIGPATAQGIRSFAFNLPGVYLETNVRSVFLHAFFPDAVGVPDRELVPLIATNCPDAPAGSCGDVAAPDAAGDVAAAAGGVMAAEGGAGSAGRASRRSRKAPLPPFATPQDADDTPRAWYYALLDYGAYLKQTLPNPSRRSAAHTRQSAFEGSVRQKRAELVRLLLADREDGAEGSTAAELAARLSAVEQDAGRPPVEFALVDELLVKLATEGFCLREDGRWRIA